MDISVQHPEYTQFRDAWQLMRDAFDGEDAVKEKGERYLPMKSGTKQMTDDFMLRDHTYNSYKMRAEFPELVSPTVRGAVGVMLEQNAVVELPPQLEGMKERATRNGTPLDVLHRNIAIELMTTGRYGLLPGMTQNGDPYLAGYNTEAIINWDTIEDIAYFVVLNETAQVRDPLTNQWREKVLYRTCELAAGRYVSQEWVPSAGNEKSFVPTADVIALRPPRGGQRKPLEVMPFVFINTNGLQACPDDVPLYGLAKLALRIYRLDADYVFAMHMTSEPTPVATGFSDVAQAIKDKIVPTSIGASNLWLLGPNSDAKYLEFSGSGISAQKEAIAAALDRAVALGAQVLSDQRRTAESGDALKLRFGNRAATLKTIAMTSAAGLEKALKNLAVWVGADEKKVQVKPNLDFFDQELNAQEIAAVVKGWQDGAYSWRTSFDRLQKGRVIPQERTPEEEQELIAEDQANQTLQPEQQIDPRTGLPIQQQVQIDPLTGKPVQQVA